jgi:plasmid stabilization system protein ParE
VAGSGAHRILRSARIELRAAARRYEEQRIGLGERFVLAIDKAINDAVADPLRWPLMPSVPDELGVRRRLVDNFPYAVVYRIVTNGIVEIVAVMHGKRSPDYWKDRR